MLVNIVAELKGLPNTTMTQTWKDRVHSYMMLHTKGENAQLLTAADEGKKTVEGASTLPESRATTKGGNVVPTIATPKPMTLRFTEEGHPLGVLDTLVQQKFGGDVFSFLDYLEKEIKTPDFTAGTFARKHGVTEGKRTLQRIVAQLKGESAHSSQMWKDRVQAYLQFKSANAVEFGHAISTSLPRFVEQAPDDVGEYAVKENSILHPDSMEIVNQEAV